MRKATNQNNIKIEYAIETMNKVIDADIREPKRTRMLSDARAICYHFLLQKGVKKQEIANYFGKSHATILHGLKLYNTFLNQDKIFQQTHEKFVVEYKNKI
jgi:chromosomal replication initiation ATPase DnaA